MHTVSLLSSQRVFIVQQPGDHRSSTLSQPPIKKKVTIPKEDTDLDASGTEVHLQAPGNPNTRQDNPPVVSKLHDSK